jgi:hypothetical protein
MTVAELIADLQNKVARGLSPDTTVWHWIDAQGCDCGGPEEISIVNEVIDGEKKRLFLY